MTNLKNSNLPVVELPDGTHPVAAAELRLQFDRPQATPGEAGSSRHPAQRALRLSARFCRVKRRGLRGTKSSSSASPRPSTMTKSTVQCNSWNGQKSASPTGRRWLCRSSLKGRGMGLFRRIKSASTAICEGLLSDCGFMAGFATTARGPSGRTICLQSAQPLLTVGITPFRSWRRHRPPGR